MTNPLPPNAHRPEVNSDDARLLADFILETGLQPVPLPAEFFYASLPLCVVDAVFSIGGTYTSTRKTVVRFCERRGWALGPVVERAGGEKAISDLLACYEGLAPD